MKTTTGEAKFDTRETKDRERKHKDARDIINFQKTGDIMRERKPWGADNQNFFRPQGFQNDWVRFNDWSGDRRNWRMNLRYDKPHRRK